MRTTSILATFLIAANLAYGETALKEGLPKTDDQKTLYALGVAIGQNVADFSLSPNELKWVTMGLHDFVQNPEKLKIDPSTFSPKIREMAQARQSKKAEVEKKKSQAFLEKQSKESGAVKEASGLIYIPIKTGTGSSPKATDKVKVHYHGTFPDGKVFDSSVQRGQPAEFPLNQVIPCWTEGLQKMKVGGKAKLICPSAIAYGDQGRPPQIPGGATLVFEVELLDILK